MLAVSAGCGQPVQHVMTVLAGRTYELVLSPLSPEPIFFQPVGEVSITFINAANGQVIATTTSNQDGYWSITVGFNLPPGLWLYAISRKTGYADTTSFVFHITGLVLDLELPIVKNETFRELREIGRRCNVSMTRRPLILAFLDPKAKVPDGSLGSLDRGAALDSHLAVTFPPGITFPVVPPGDRRWLGFFRGIEGIYCARDFRIHGFTPYAFLIYNAQQWPHTPGSGVRAYHIGYVEPWPRPPFERKGLQLVVEPPGYAPTTTLITVGVVRVIRQD